MTRVLTRRPAGKDHAVLSIAGGDPNSHRRAPCSDCPWRKDAVGEFPAEAFRHSASTGYDVPELIDAMLRNPGLSPSTFACHQSGKAKPATCAGFLLSVAADNSLAMRLRRAPWPKVGNPKGVELFADYYDMAVANGVPFDDPTIVPCVRSTKQHSRRFVT